MCGCRFGVSVGGDEFRISLSYCILPFLNAVMLYPLLLKYCLYLKAVEPEDYTVYGRNESYEYCMNA